MTDAERHRSLVHFREVPIEQIRFDARLPGLEHLLGDLAAGLEPAVRKGRPVARPAHRELEVPLRVGQHDEPAFGPADGDRRVHHQHKHIVEHPRGAQGSQPLEQCGHLPQVADRFVAASGRQRCLVHRTPKGQLGAFAAKADTVAIVESPFSYRRAVDERTVARPAVADGVPLARRHDLRVYA